MKAIISRILLVSFLYSSVCLDIIAMQAAEEYKTCHDVATMFKYCNNGQTGPYILKTDEFGGEDQCLCPATTADFCIYLAENLTSPAHCLSVSDKDFSYPWYVKDAEGNIKNQRVTCNCKTIKNDYCTDIKVMTDKCKGEASTFTLGGTGITCNCPSSPRRNFQEIGGGGGVAGLVAGLVAATGLIILLIVKLRQYVINKALQELSLTPSEMLVFKGLEKKYRELSPEKQADFLSNNADLLKYGGTDSDRFKRYMSFDSALLQLKQVETIGKLMAQRGVQVGDLLGGKGFKLDIPKIGKIGQADITSALKGASGALESLDLKTSAFTMSQDLLSQVTRVIEVVATQPSSAKLKTASEILKKIIASLQDEIKKDPLAGLTDENDDLTQTKDFLEKKVDAAIQERIKRAEKMAKSDYQDDESLGGSDVDTQAAAKRTDVTTKIQDDGTGGNGVDKDIEPGKEDGDGVSGGGDEEPRSPVEEAYDFR